MTLTIGGRYNWIGQPERLVYIGQYNGWYQFAKIDDPDVVWCEVSADLNMIEETKE